MTWLNRQSESLPGLVLPTVGDFRCGLRAFVAGLIRRGVITSAFSGEISISSDDMLAAKGPGPVAAAVRTYLRKLRTLAAMKFVAVYRQQADPEAAAAMLELINDEVTGVCVPLDGLDLPSDVPEKLSSWYGRKVYNDDNFVFSGCERSATICDEALLSALSMFFIDAGVTILVWRRLPESSMMNFTCTDQFGRGPQEIHVLLNDGDGNTVGHIELLDYFIPPAPARVSFSAAGNQLNARASAQTAPNVTPHALSISGATSAGLSTASSAAEPLSGTSPAGRKRAKSPTRTGDTPDACRLQSSNACACCATTVAPLKKGKEAWRHGRVGWRLAAVVAMKRWIPQIHRGSIRLCNTCDEAIPRDLRAVVQELICFRGSIDIDGDDGPVNLMISGMRPMLRAFVNDWKLEKDVKLAEHLEALPANDEVALATSPIGGTAIIVPLTGPGNNDMGGSCRLLKCDAASGTVKVRMLVGSGRVRTLDHNRLFRTASNVVGLFGNPAPPTTRSTASATSLGPPPDQLVAQGALYERNEALRRATESRREAASLTTAVAKSSTKATVACRRAAAAEAATDAVKRRAAARADRQTRVAQAEADAKIESATADAETAEQRLTRATLRIDSLKAENERLTAERDAARQRADSASTRVEYLEERSREARSTAERDVAIAERDTARQSLIETESNHANALAELESQHSCKLAALQRRLEQSERQRKADQTAAAETIAAGRSVSQGVESGPQKRSPKVRRAVLGSMIDPVDLRASVTIA